MLCWGGNAYGQVGDGTTTERLTPTAVAGLSSGVSALAAGGRHTCAVTSGGDARCWGDNGYGQLGDGTTTTRLTPVAVAGLTGSVAGAAAGTSHTCAVTTGGSLVCWGFDGYGQIGIGTRSFITTPLAAYGYGGAIAVSGISPGTGPAGGGTAVTISGAYFLQGASITIGGVAAANVTIVTPATITAATSAHPAGTADVVVTNPDASQAVLPGAFTYQGGGAGASVRSDFTGDRKSDVLWRHATQGDLWLWPMAGGARTAETYVRTLNQPGWEIRGLGDQTGDG